MQSPTQKIGYDRYKANKDLVGPENMPKKDDSMLPGWAGSGNTGTSKSTSNAMAVNMPFQQYTEKDTEHPITKQIRLKMEAIDSGDPVRFVRAIGADDTKQFLLHLRKLKQLYGIQQ